MAFISAVGGVPLAGLHKGIDGLKSKSFAAAVILLAAPDQYTKSIGVPDAL